MKSFRLNANLALSGLIAIVIIFSPLVLLKIGPKGYDYYGPDVPDIYIYGGMIFGKDRSFLGIDFAWKFQLNFIILFIVLNGLAFKFIKNISLAKAFVVLNFFLLLLFPLWLTLYVDGVICNSDGADLSIYLLPSLYLYALLFVLHIQFLLEA